MLLEVYAYAISFPLIPGHAARYLVLHKKNSGGLSCGIMKNGRYDQDYFQHIYTEYKLVRDKIESA